MRIAVALAILLTIGWPAESAEGPTGRLVFLDLKAGRILTANTDGSDLKVLLEGRRSADGVAVDAARGHIYWTNMGRVKSNDGSIERMDLDGKNVTTIASPGSTHTPKQLKLVAGKLYWSDREGMRVMRANTDGTGVEILIETGRTEEDRMDARNWCVGIAVDVAKSKLYWTQKGGDNAGTGSLRRANLAIPKGQTAASRTDIEILFDKLPEPIDLDLDLGKRQIYWTDRGDPPYGNTVNRTSIDPQPGIATRSARRPEVLVHGLEEGIGIALDLKGGRMFFTDLGGSVYSAKPDGSQKKVILSDQGRLTGIAYFELPRGRGGAR
ncbi:MAG: 3-hydroxyacyl-CoA dehydrogenase [Bryobacteraceae bacterium]